MRSISFALLFLCVVLFVSCKSKKDTALFQVDKVYTLDSLPSGSGVALYHDSIFILSDDAPFFYLLSLNDNKYLRHQLHDLDTTIYRIEKKVKPDYEAACIGDMSGEKMLFSFGSGSDSTHRDSLLLIDPVYPVNQAKFSLSALYAHIRIQTRTDVRSWNIEAATVSEKTLYLLNRGNNMIISFSLEELAAYLEDQNRKPSVRFHKIKLPLINNREARFSGLATINDSTLLFSASVEDTPDWTSDGPILGSYIGTIDLRNNTASSSYLLTDKAGKPLIEKIESVEFISRTKNDMLRILAVSDNDNGSTKLFHISMPLK